MTDTTSSDPGTSIPDEAAVSVLQAGMDTGIRNTDRKGTRKGPEKLLSRVDDEALADTHLDTVFLDDFHLGENQELIADRVQEHLTYQHPLVTIGGDHATTYPILRVMKEQYPDLRLLWLDAHLDYKEPRIEDGTPHDALVRRLCEENGFLIDDFWFIGHRATDPDEQYILSDIHKTAPAEIDTVIEDLQQGVLPDDIPLAPEDPVYLSLDIDLVDASHVPGTTFPVPDGPGPDQVSALLEALGAQFGGQLVGADIVEIAEPFDEGGQTLELGATLFQTLLSMLEEQDQPTKTYKNDS